MIEKKNVATLYLLPGIVATLKVGARDFDKMGFINLYLTDVNHEKKWEDAVYMLFKPVDPIHLGEFILKYEEYIIDEYDYDGGYTVIVMFFPIQYIANYAAFKQGKYSWFTQEYKDLFPKIASAEEKLIGLQRSTFFCVFNKSHELRKIIEDRIGEKLPIDSELASYPGEEVELKIEKLTAKKETNV